MATLPSSEYWRDRRYFTFYKHLHCILQRYGGTAASVLDVGSSLPPFVNTLGWAKSKTIIGPRFAGNVGKGGGEILTLNRIEEKFGVTAVRADFLEWTPPLLAALAAGASAAGVPTAADGSAVAAYDLVLCSEVVEHVDKPREFVRKLLATGRVVVLSVPYRWDACDNTKCHHKTNQITRDKIAAWAGRQPNAFDIVEEPTSGERRIICVYT